MSRILRVITRSVAVAGLSLLLLQAILIVIDGVLRATASISIDAVRDIGSLVTAVAAACCLPLVLSESGNIVMRPLAAFKNSGIARAADIFGAFVAAAVMVVLTAQFFSFALTQMHAGEVTFMLNISKAPFYFVIAAVLGLGAVVQTFSLLRLFTNERGD